MATKSPSPNFTSVYNWLNKGEEEEHSLGREAIEAAGGGFTVGTVVASLYHFGKGLLRKEGTLIAGVNAARAYGPRFGGTFALVYLPVDVTWYAIRRFDDSSSSSSSLDGIDIAACAAIGALLRAPRGGLGSAFRAALVCAAVPAALAASNYYLLNSHLQHHPYSYPHYRTFQQQQQQQQDN